MNGSPERMGAEHGRQMGSTIRDLHAKYLKAYFSSEGPRFLAMTAAAAFEQHVLPEHRDELRALAKSAGVEDRQMLLAHCFLDLSPMSTGKDAARKPFYRLDLKPYFDKGRQSVASATRPSAFD